MDTMSLHAKTINEDDILDYIQKLIEEVVEAGQQGQAAHQVESSLFKHRLDMGLQLLTLFFSFIWSGKQGEIVHKKRQRQTSTPSSLY